MSALDDRIGGQRGRNQVIKTFHEPGAGERLRDDDGGGGRPPSSSGRTPNAFVASMTVLPFQLDQSSSQSNT